jgi:hypothetical protein
MYAVYLHVLLYINVVHNVCSCQCPAVDVAGHILLRSEWCDICVVRKLRDGTARAVFRIW